MSSDNEKRISKLEMGFITEMKCLSDILLDRIKERERDGRPLSFSSTAASMAIGGLFGLNPIPPSKIMNVFIDRSQHHWERVAREDLAFLQKECVTLFEGIPAEYLTEVASIFSDEKLMTPEIIAAMWRCLRVMVEVCIKYVHWMRYPNEAGVPTKNFFPIARDGEGIIVSGISVKNGIALFELESLEP